MLVPNQKIQVKWRPNTRKHYVSKGYVFTNWDEPFYVNAEDLPSTAKITVQAICDYCGEIFPIWYGRYNLAMSEPIDKCCCEKCKGKKLAERLHNDSCERIYNEFIQLCNEYGFEAISEKEDCVTTKAKLKYKCPIHGIQEHNIEYLRENGCQECKKDERKRLVSENSIRLFEKLCKERGYTPLSTVDEVQNEGSWFRYICPKHGEQKIHLKDLKLGHGCIKCKHEYMSNLLRLSEEEAISVIESKNNNKLLNPHEYKTAITNNLKIRCGSCGEVFTCSLNNYTKNYDGKCSHCHDKSVGELKIHDILHKYNIKFDPQHVFPDCKNIKVLRFDFFLEDYNCVIEFDGIYHFYPVHGEEDFQNSKKRDEIKNNYCKENNIRMIRIPYWEEKNLEDIIVYELNLEKI